MAPTGAVAETISNQGEAVSQGPGILLFFLPFAFGLATTPVEIIVETGRLGRTNQTHRPVASSPVFQIPADLTWVLPFGGIW